MSNLDFKKLTHDNWLKPDEVMKGFARITPDGTAQPVSGTDWLQYVMEPQLQPAVPEDVRNLFEVARSSLAYGYFFYPLYTLAVEQLYRVAEAAIVHKCKLGQAPNSAHTFAKKIEWLVQIGIIPKTEREWWHSIRMGRNWASHPESQTILTPGIVIGILQSVTAKINLLFSGG